MDKKRQIKFNLNGFLLSSSFALDFVQKYKKATPLGHSKRVAYISLNIGIKFGLNPQELADLCAYCLCHNIALNQADDNSYCELSNEYIKDFPFLLHKQDILKYQNKTGDEIPLFSQIISLSVSIDEKFDLVNLNINDRYKIIDFVKSKQNLDFSKNIVDVFVDISLSISFWFDLKYEQDLILFIYSSLYDFTLDMNFDDVLKITSVFSKIENPNSKLIEYTNIMCEYYEFDFKDSLTLQIAASLSKIGKLVINNSDEQKFYPYYTKKVLSNIIGFSDITSWAANIEERLDGSGCFGVEAKDLSFKHRVLGVLNIYDDLLQIKKYTHKEAIGFLQKEASNKKFDLSIINDIDKNL